MTVFDAATFLVTPRGAPPLAPDAKVYANDVRIVPTPPSLLNRERRPRGVKKLGLMYECRVLDVLEAIYRGAFLRSPCIQYVRHGKRHWAIPDGLLYLASGTLAVIEVKLGHTEAVWDQLMERYRPLAKLLHPALKIRTVEICRSYDPAINVPHSCITSLHAAAGGPALEVMMWKI